MDRRSLLKTGLLAGVATLIPLPRLAAQTTDKNSDLQQKGDGFHRFQLGDLELTILSDGHILQTPIQPFMCPNAEKAELENLLKENFRTTNSVDLAMNVMLVKKGEKYILLDAGMGIFATNADNNWLLKSLSKAGIKPENITDIFISHAHPDHIGGLVDKDQNLVFKNAAIYLSKTEYNFWTKASVNDFRESPLFKMQEALKPIINGVQNVLKSIQPKLKFYPENGQLMDNFTFIPIPGHTPGMVMIQLASKGENLAYIADLIHHDILLFEHPEWGFSGDTNLALATQTRIKTLQQLNGSRTKIFAYHLPWPGLGYAGKNNQTFRWVPEVFATP